MKLFFFDIPGNKEELVLWLEDMILSENFESFYNELVALYGPKQNFEISEEKFSEIIRNGFGKLDEKIIRHIIREPDLLLNVHNKILTEGEEYWNLKALRIQPPIKAFDFKNQLFRISEGAAPEPNIFKKKFISYLGIGVAFAAGIYLMLSDLIQPRFPKPVFIEDNYASKSEKLEEKAKTIPALDHQTQTTQGKQNRGFSVAWGWAKPDAIPEVADPKQYLIALADSGNEWFKKKPLSPFEISKRILEFRAGCNVLIFAEHKCLAERDKKWFLDRCKSFAKELDDSITKIENGYDAGKIKNELDQKINIFLNAIRSRSDSVG